MFRYYFYDRTTYREDSDTMRIQAFIDDEWRYVIPSEEDQTHMREISEDEAMRLVEEAA